MQQSSRIKPKRGARVWWLAAGVLAAIGVLVALVALWWSVDEAVETAQEPAKAAAKREGFTFKGRVLDAESRAGVAGASVTLRGAGQSFEMEADARGDFSFYTVVEAQRWEIEAGASGYFPDPRPLSVVAKAGEISEVKVQVFRQGRVLGRVMHQGKPVEGAGLRLIRLGQDGQPEALEEKTGAGGGFELTVMPGRMRVEAVAPGLAPGQSRELNVVGGKPLVGVVIDLTERGALVVEVLDPEGEPVKGAHVNPTGLPFWNRKGSVTDEKGLVRLESVPVGELGVRVWAPSYSEAKSGPVVVEAESEATLRVVLEPLQGISGRVVSATGHAVRGAQVLMRPVGVAKSATTVRSSGDGLFGFSQIDAGRYEISATHPRHGPSQVVVVGTEEKGLVELVMVAGGSISGTVLSPEGDPVQRFTVVVDAFEPESGSGVEGARLGPQHYIPSRNNNAEGSFSVPDLAPGTYTLLADAPGYAFGRVEGLRLGVGRSLEGVVLRLTRGAVFSGQVLDAQTRQPIEGARVMQRDMDRRLRNLEPMVEVTDADGEFLMEGLSPGRRSLTVAAKGYVSRVLAGVEVRQNDQESLEIMMEPLGEGDGPKMEFFGIGATLEATDAGTIRLKSLIDGAPAQSFGLKAGDEILRIDGQEVRDLGLGRAVELIRGEEGAGVVLEVQRRGDPYPFTTEIERGRVVHPSRR